MIILRTVWPVVFARLVALAGLFVSGSSALGLLPASWQRPVALASMVIIALASALPEVHKPANVPDGTQITDPQQKGNSDV